MNLDEIRVELEAIADHDVLLYGSSLSVSFRNGSDVDIAILAHSTDLQVMSELKLRILQLVPEKYDVQVFEALPTTLKASILNSYEVVFGDPLEIGEYLYRYWKEWQDYESRLEMPTVEDMRRAAGL